MKKVIGLAVLFTAISINAATCNWNVTQIAVDPNNVAKSSYTAYLIDASVTDVATMTAALKAENFSYLRGEGLERSATVSTLMGGRVYESGFGDYTIGQDYTFYTVLLNGDTKSATYFYISDSVTAYPTQNAPLIMGWQNLSTQKGMTTSDWQQVPEPTSGLLLLVGGALLALRRKQK